MARGAADAGPQIPRLRRLRLVLALLACALATPAAAGAWTKNKGELQVILKAESMRATQGYGPDGIPTGLPAERRDQLLGVFAEYGLTKRLTLQIKGDFQRGEDAFVDYEGRGPIEIGVTWQVWRNDHAAVSLYAGYADGGEGRNAGYAAPGEGDSDWEVRASVGQSSMPEDQRDAATFMELQVARRYREGLADETRVDFTYGTHLGRGWSVLTQAFAGATDDGGARWLSLENSIVHHRGDWSFQAGWRQTIAGRETPRASGPMLAIWRRF